MRICITLSLLLLLGSCSPTKTISSSSTNSMNGTWMPIKQEMSGMALPELVYKAQRLIIKDSTYTLTAESIDKGIVKLNGDKMDIYGKEGVNSGKHFTGLYKLENGQLTVCYNLKGDKYPDSFDTKGKPMYFMSVFKKVE